MLIWVSIMSPAETKVKLVKVLYYTERRLGQSENMREGRLTLSSCGVGEEYREYRGWREIQTYGSSRTSNRNVHWSQG